MNHTKDYNSLKTIDLELGIELAHGQKNVALDLLATLRSILPRDYQAVQTAYERGDSQKLLETVHFLNSGTCYCGVPRLRQVIRDLHQAVKEQDKSLIPCLYQELSSSVNDFMKSELPSN